MKPVLSEISTDVELSVMTEHDLLEVVEIEERSALSRWGWEAYYAELQSSNRSLMWVARISQPLENPKTYNLAGYIVARLGAGEIHINNVAVRNEYQRRGLGQKLLNTILAEGRRLGAGAGILEVRAGNYVAKALYERCGFRVIARRRNYYSDPVEDALLMTVSINQDA
jgi:[ribosomal protein S18]-alanine N-acetyltransferase